MAIDAATAAQTREGLAAPAIQEQFGAIEPRSRESLTFWSTDFSDNAVSPMPHKSHRFQATIYRIWILRYVDVPEEIGRALENESRKKKHIPVVAIANGRSARTTLTPAGGGRYRLQVNTILRKAARADTGDLIGIELRLDRGSRVLPVPEEIRAALRTRPRARQAFEQMGPGSRRQLLLWFGNPRSAAVRQKRLGRIIEMLSERALLAGNRSTRPDRRRS